MPMVHVPDMPKIQRVDALELQTYWHRFFASARYRENLIERILAGEAAHMEILLHHVTYGKPKENIALQADGDASLTLIIGGETKVELRLGEGGMVQRVNGTEQPQAALPPAPEPPSVEDTPSKSGISNPSIPNFLPGTPQRPAKKLSAQRKSA